MLKDLLKIVEGDLKLVMTLVYKRKHPTIFTPWSSFNWSTRTRNLILRALKFQKSDWIEDFDDYPDINAEDLPLVMVSELVTVVIDRYAFYSYTPTSTMLQPSYNFMRTYHFYFYPYQR